MRPTKSTLSPLTRTLFIAPALLCLAGCATGTARSASVRPLSEVSAPAAWSGAQGVTAKAGATLAYGNFVTLTINFLIIAFVLFIVIRLMNRWKAKEEASPAPTLTKDQELLSEIRDLLKK